MRCLCVTLCVFYYALTRGPPFQAFVIHTKTKEKEEITVKYTPKKVFILEEGKYQEITYAELQNREAEKEEYRSKRFLPLYGMLMEVTEEDYRSYYKDERRQRYIEERAREFGLFSYDALTTEEFNGEDILVDSMDAEEEVEVRLMLEKLRGALLSLSEDERSFIRQHFFEGKSQTELSLLYGVNQSSISRKLARILSKLKKLLEK